MELINNFYRKHSQRLQYGLAVGTVLLSLVFQLLLIPLLGGTSPFLLFTPAVVLSAWYGGLKPGLVATFLSGLLSIFLFVAPSLTTNRLSYFVQLGLFVLLGLLISVLIEKLLVAKRTAEGLASSLQENEASYRLIVQEIKSYAIYALDQNGLVTSWNAGAERIYGYLPREIINQPFSRFFTPEDRESGKPERGIQIATTVGQFEEEGWRVRKDGSRFWASILITALRDEAGELRGFSKVTRDITKYKQATDTARESLDTLQQSLTELSNIKSALEKSAIVSSTDAQGVITYVNDQFCDISQYSQNELIGKTHRLVNSGYHSTAFFKNFWSTISAGQIWQGQIKNQSKADTYYWVDTSVVPFLDEQGKPIQYLAIGFDITERKRMEEALTDSEEQLRLVLESAQLSTWDWNIQTGQLHWSPDKERLFGLKPGTFKGTFEAFLECVHPEDREAVQQAVNQAIKNKNPYEDDFRIIWPDGSIHWVYAKSMLFCDETGQVMRMIGTAMDVTAHKQSEVALQQQAERERILSGIIQRMRQSLDLEEILSTTVKEVRQFLQTDRVIIYRFESNWSGEVVVESVTDRWTPLEGMVSRKPLTEKEIQLHQKGQIISIEDIYTADLEPQQLELLTQFQARANLVIPILQGERLWGLLMAHHCSAPREWQLWEQDLLQELVNQLAIAIQQSQFYQEAQRLNANLERQIQKRTAQLQQALGFEAVLKRINEKVRDSIDERQILQTAVRELALSLHVGSCHASLYNLEQKTATICYEYTISMPSSHGRLLEMSSFPEIYDLLLAGKSFQFCSISVNPVQGQAAMLACPVFDDQGVMGDLWLLHRTDYAFNNLEIRLAQQVANQCAIAIRQARLFQQAQAQVEELEKLNRLKDHFLSTVSHELRTPVSNMKMAIRMLEITLKRTGVLNEDGSKAERYLQILHDECEREISLINDLLDLQRLEAGVQPLALETIEVQSWLLQMVQPFQERAQARGQRLQVHLPPDLPLLIVSDLMSLERILAELLSNACKYTPPGEQITVTAYPKPKQLQLKVINYGTEIPASELPRIFDKFYRVPGADPWKQGGTGLGLALVQKLAEHLRGNIQVESAVGRTTFTLTLPLDANGS